MSSNISSSYLKLSYNCNNILKIRFYFNIISMKFLCINFQNLVCLCIPLPFCIFPCPFLIFSGMFNFCCTQQTLNNTCSYYYYFFSFCSINKQTIRPLTQKLGVTKITTKTPSTAGHLGTTIECLIMDNCYNRCRPWSGSPVVNTTLVKCTELITSTTVSSCMYV